MSSVNSNFGMESLGLVMTKRANESQGRMALSVLEGAAQTAQTAQSVKANAPAPKAPTAIDANKGTIIDTTA